MFAVLRRLFPAKASSTPTEAAAAVAHDLKPDDGAVRPGVDLADGVATAGLSWWGASLWWASLLLSLILMGLAALQGWYDPQWGVPHNLPIGVWAVVAAGFGFAAVLCALVLLAQLQRAALAQQNALVQSEAQARAQEKEARRINDASQAAILRLMNELQQVAEGDLTQQATVSEDVTGAIADSVNYTVEELRNLVQQVQTTTLRVGETAERAEDASIKLLAASTEQLHGRRGTGKPGQKQISERR